MNKPVVAAVIISMLAGVIGVYVVLVYPIQRLPVVVSLTTGVAVTLFTAYVVYLLQYPSFEAKAMPGETTGRIPGSRPDVATTRWVHVLVRNRSPGFLGGGTASGVGGVVVIERNGKKQSFMTKWERQRNPLALSQVVVAGNSVINVSYDSAQVEAAKRETLDPGDSKSLDIAFKTLGDPRCFISVPENFQYPDLKNPQAALDPGDHPFELFIDYRHTRKRVGRFVLRNQEGTEPETLSVIDC